MQSRLPDINTAFNTHRKRVIIALERREWTECLGALYALNALLPLEYRVIISQKKYDALTKQDLLATCKGCEEEIDYNTIKVLNIISVSIECFISGNKTTKVWYCPKCKYENKLLETKVEQTVLSQPYYLGVVPPPPQRRDGMIARIRYDQGFERWAWTMFDELEERMAQYRDDNWDRGEEKFDDVSNINTDWEAADAAN